MGDNEIKNGSQPPQNRLQNKSPKIINSVLEQNLSKPVALTEIKVNGGSDFRDGFLQNQLDPLFKSATLQQLMTELETTGSNIERFGRKVSYELDLAESSVSLGTSAADSLALKAIVKLDAVNRSSFHVKSLTRNNEGGLKFSADLKNVLGGAENLNLTAVFGTRPNNRSSYEATLGIPLQGSSLWRAVINGYARSENAVWASHSQVIRGLQVALNKSVVKGSSEQSFDIGFNAVNRTVLGIGAAASDLVRAAAGDNLKSSIFASYKHACQNKPINPTNGFSLEATAEYAGRNGILPGDVEFFKGTASASLVKALSKTNDAVVLSVGGSLGILLAEQSSILDRFYLGGPKQLHGFEYNRLGPKDDSDSIGGDLYLYGNAKLYTKVPGMSNSPLRAVMLANGGSLIGMDGSSNGNEKYQRLADRVSSAVGVGISYKVPQAQLELIYCVPTSQQPSDVLRRGWQFAVSVEA